MAFVEDSERAQTPQKVKGSLLRDAIAAIRIRGEKPYEFTPIEIEGKSLSETIIRERRGER